MTLQETSNNIINNKRLSVQVALTGLSFLVKDSTLGVKDFFLKKSFTSPLNPEELLLEIKKCISENTGLQSNFGEVTVVYANEIHTTVPKELFDESKISEYLKFNSKILVNDYIAHDTISDHNLVVVYVPYVNINNYFFEQYGSFQYYHGISIFLKKVLDREKYAIVPKVYLHIQKDQFYCVILKNGKLELCNTYNFRTSEDFIYYTLFCFEQLKLNNETVLVFVCGEIEENDANYDQLFKYIRNISFLTSDIRQDEDISGEAAHKNFIIGSIEE